MHKHIDNINPKRKKFNENQNILTPELYCFHTVVIYK